MASAPLNPPMAEPIYVPHVPKACNDALRVVVVQLVLLPPTVTVAVNTVLAEPLVVIRTFKVWPDVIEPKVPHAPPLTLICGLPLPETETASPPLEHLENAIGALLLVETVL